jgi:Mn2+/Fe2+ NRAMP family transporter
VNTAADAARAQKPFAGRFAEALFAVGLLGASLLAAAVLPVTAAYVIAETFGFERGLSRTPREAPVFVGVVTALVVVGAVVAMVPGVPVFRLLVGVQAVNGVLLPITLFFVWRLSASKEVMGRYRNGRAFDVLAGLTVLATSALSLILLAVTVAGL